MITDKQTDKQSDNLKSNLACCEVIANERRKESLLATFIMNATTVLIPILFARLSFVRIPFRFLLLFAKITLDMAIVIQRMKNKVKERQKMSNRR